MAYRGSFVRVFFLRECCAVVQSLIPPVRYFLRCFPTPSQVFRQNKRATDVHDIIGFRIVVNPRSPSPHAHSAGSENVPSTRTSRSTSANYRELKEKKLLLGKGRPGPAGADVLGEMEGGDEKRTVSVGGGSKSARPSSTVHTFPPPYRDPDSQVLHDVYEVLIGLFEEVPGRYKVRMIAPSQICG